MKCEECDFDLPSGWPLTPVAYPADDPAQKPITVNRALCVPCSRPAPARDGHMTPYRALAPYVPPGPKVGS